MDVQSALDILEIEKDEYFNMTIISLNKKYRKLALQYHPDKNGNSPESTQKFQLIYEAYEVVKREKENKTFTENNSNNPNDDAFFNPTNDYIILLNSFLQSILKNETININIKGDNIFDIIQEIVIHGSLQYFEKMGKERCIEIYDFITRHKHIFHINGEIIEKMKKIVSEKTKNDCLYVINPSLDDLLENNIYKLVHRGEIFFVPLWHSELYFEDKEKNDIIVRCIPDLPQHIMIDENNSLHIELNIPFNVSFLDNPFISFQLGKKPYEYTVPIRLKKNQNVFLPDVGVSNIQENITTMNVDVDKKSGIYVKITFY